MLQWIKNLFSPPKPAGPSEIIKRFEGPETPISQDVTATSEGGWQIDSREAQTIRLFEVEIANIDNCMLTYRADLKSENLQGRGYLEMWCRIPGGGEFFSKGFQNALKGTNDWASYEVPFYLKSGQQPDLIKLNLTVEGSGKVWIKKVELSYTPFE
ncbi:MAG: hypothetical protein KME65_14770 [Candidatus Thiodiazotropha sp. (ex Ctena orbiculata)]|uniref:Uncharacterized protein n=1 Tax=Candidatus Thiodiazotropha taylori TaxID=2792791 RepID=A0A944QVP1_9GAMM|nr:hypothetical protein [Candidatus Thiodiazotropha taylori]MBV2138527.1 hypothetical protein [Candidatus Thiodiazotropha taylori]